MYCVMRRNCDHLINKTNYFLSEQVILHYARASVVVIYSLNHVLEPSREHNLFSDVYTFHLPGYVLCCLYQW